MKWLLLPAFASPQARPLPVTGVVADPSLRALPGARVEVTANDGTPAASTTTSRDGAFRVLLVPGRYTVTVAFSVFQALARWSTFSDRSTSSSRSRFRS